MSKSAKDTTLYKAEKRGTRWVVEVAAPDAGESSGTSLTFTRKGVEVSGWFDHVVSTGNGWGLSWADIETIRKVLVQP